jgi:Fe-S oxidoreductase
MAVFRDELVGLMPDDADARLLAERSELFDSFVAARIAPAESHAGRKVLVHGHCHQKALFDAGATGRLLGSLGFDATVLDAGCCGLAGAFGFRHFEVSRQIGERALFPALRAAPGATVIADGFSCREQIRQFTGRRALHLAELLREPDAPALVARDPEPQREDQP